MRVQTGIGKGNFHGRSRSFLISFLRDMFNCGTVPVEQYLSAFHHITAHFVEPHEEDYSGSRIVSSPGVAPGLPRFPAMPVVNCPPGSCPLSWCDISDTSRYIRRMASARS
jgi:hypothetical protein